MGMWELEQGRLREKSRLITDVQWPCVGVACVFLVLQVALGGWWWSASIALVVAMVVLTVLHSHYVRQYDRLSSESQGFVAPASRRPAGGKK